MVYEQLSLFETEETERYKIKKPIRLIEFFAGYGSQALALKYLGVPFQTWRTCEWAIKSIQAYRDIHHPGEKCSEAEELSKEEKIDYLFKKGISSNYNEPMKREQIARLGETKINDIYNNIQVNHNLVNIQQVHAEDLGIVEQDKYTYLLTYSFPCQDLSLSGKCKGMSRNSGTRSGMLWEVERILEECYDKKTLPEILIMENVPQVHAKKNLKDFAEWINKLSVLGYKSYYDDLNAKNYGIPQNRVRCFMVSILDKESNFILPKRKELKIRLKNILESKVDEGYYLSKKMLDYIVSEDDKYKVNEGNLVVNRNIACAKSTREGQTREDCSDFVSDELDSETNIRVAIKNATKQGYSMAEPGDGIDISTRMEYHRGTVQKGLSQTIQTQCDIGVIEEPRLALKAEMCEQLIKSGAVKENDVIRHSYTNSRIKGEMKDIQQNNMCPTLDTRYDCLGVATKEPNTNLRIRKLTPTECMRLMGVKDEDSRNCNINQNNASMYHLAGDSIVTSVLMAIFGELLDIDWNSKVNELVHSISNTTN